VGSAADELWLSCSKPFPVNNEADLLRIGTARNFQCVRCGATTSAFENGSESCASCGATFDAVDGIVRFLLPESDGDMENYYDRVAGNVRAGSHSYMPAAQPYLELSYRIVSNALRDCVQRWLVPGSSILDVGCGHGARLAPLASSYRLTGVDLSAQNLQHARTHGFEAVQADARRLPFRDGTFDAVVSSEVIQHFDDAAPYVREMVRVCRPGGTVLISTMNCDSVLRRLLRVARRLRGSRQLMPLTQRRPRQFVSAGPADLENVAWVLSPTSLVVAGTHASHPLAPLATNFIVRLRVR
jgi:SAM-dependent methyltransferase